MPPEALVQDAKSKPSSAGREHMLCWAGLAIVLGTLAAFFHRSVFLGKPIAKLGTLINIDALFDPGLKQAIVNIGKDPSGYLIFFPNGHFEDSMWSKFVPPIWNPLVACGFPNLGDPQSLIHSPAHLLRLFSSPAAYNAGLLLEIALGGAGMFLLSRSLRLSMPAAVFASLAFVLSPCILLQVDIGNNESLFPWVFLAFVYLVKQPSVLRAALVGVVCAVVAFSAHPETTFFAVLFAALLSFFLMAMGRASRDSSPASSHTSPASSVSPSSASSSSSSSSPSPASSITDGGDAFVSGFKGERASSTKFGDSFGMIFIDSIKGIGLLLVCAFVSLAVASPLIFPFAEFMRDAHLYKDANAAISIVNWQHFVEGYYSILGDNPYFIGAVAALLVPIGLCARGVLSVAISLTLLFAFVICLPQGPVLNFLSQKPFSFVATLYGVPEIMLMLCLLAGMGVDRVIQRLKPLELLLLCVSAVMVVLIPYTYLENSLGTQDFNLVWRSGHNLLSATSVFGVLAFALCVLAQVKKSAIKTACLVGLLVLNFSSLAMASRTALPTNPQFSIEPPAPLAFLKESGSRALATGGNFFLSNVNLDFDVQDLRCFSPLLPKRYVKFIEACGARCYNLYFYVFPDYCSPLLDLASVKYVMTRAAVRPSQDAKLVANLDGPKYTRIMPGLRIVDSSFRYDAANSQVDADIELRIHDLCNYQFALQYCVFDADGTEVWSSRELIISPAEKAHHLSLRHESFPVPKSAKYPVYVGMRVKDTWISKFVLPDGGSSHIEDAFVLCQVDSEREVSADAEVKSDDSALKKHFVLSAEYPVQGCRIYQNDRA
ncbi:MAG: hypothetical protein K2X81_13610, partial [Candidatus Obscuribacterales bacterium]|nr:hypothetical protein [Candidatus Obscuribacterales bacterium]